MATTNSSKSLRPSLTSFAQHSNGHDYLSLSIESCGSSLISHLASVELSRYCFASFMRLHHHQPHLGRSEDEEPVEVSLLSFGFKNSDFSSAIFLGSGSFHPQWIQQNSISLEANNTSYGCRMDAFQFLTSLSSYLGRTRDTC